MNDNDTIYIIFKNGNIVVWRGNEYTDYDYDRKCFIITNNRRWMGVYPIEGIESIEIGRSHYVV